MTHNLMTLAKAIADYDFHLMLDVAACELIGLSVAAAKQNWALAAVQL